MFLWPTFDRLTVNQHSWEIVIQFWAKGNWFFYKSLLFIFSFCHCRQFAENANRTFHFISGQTDLSCWMWPSWNCYSKARPWFSTQLFRWTRLQYITHSCCLQCEGCRKRELNVSEESQALQNCEMSSQWILVYRESWPTRKHPEMSRDKKVTLLFTQPKLYSRHSLQILIMEKKKIPPRTMR